MWPTHTHTPLLLTVSACGNVVAEWLICHLPTANKGHRLEKNEFRSLKTTPQSKRIAANLICWIPVGNAQSVHCTYHRVHCHEDVLIDEFDETASVVVRVPSAMNDSHLLDERALAGLAGACTRQHTHRSKTFIPDQFTCSRCKFYTRIKWRSGAYIHIWLICTTTLLNVRSSAII